MKKKIIKVRYKNRQIIGDIILANSLPKVLCLHGGGVSNRKRYENFRKLLAESNISSCAFDYWGHGETGGDIGESNLKDRTEQATKVVEGAKVIKPLSIAASSMSAYTAIKLTQIYQVSLMVLIVPAVYGRELYEVNFGKKFSDLIRKDLSWEDTDAWEILDKYKGKLLIISAGKDDVIPKEVVHKLYDSAKNAESREIISFPDASHKIMGAYFDDNLNDLQKLISKIVALLK